MPVHRIDDMPMTADYIRLALREGRAAGLSEAEMLEGTALDAGALARNTVRTTQRDNFTVMDNVTRALGNGWMLRRGIRFGAETTGPLGQAVTSAATVGDAFRVFEVYGQSRSPRYRLRLARAAGGRTALEAVETMPISEMSRLWGDEGLLLSIQSMIETLIGAEIADANFRFRSPRPEHAALYTIAFRGPVTFGQSSTRMEFPSSWLTRAGPFTNIALHAAANAALELERRTLESEGLIAAELEQVLVGSLADNPRLDDVAAQLGLSSRTLARRLLEAGTNFRGVRDAVMSRRARALLTTTGRPVSEISDELGYANPVAFNTACHRWFGMSPRALRRAGTRA